MIRCADIFPSVSEVDFSDVADVTGYAYLLSAVAAQCSREENPGKGALMRRQVKSAATEWLKDVEKSIGALSAGDALAVTESYDSVCGIVNGFCTDRPFVSKNRLRAFEARIHGDETVNQYALQQAVTREIDRHNPKFFGSPLQWKSISLDRWHRQFRHGVSLTPASDYDTLQRVSCLLSNDLWAFETRNESRFKQTLFENHQHYLESMHNAKSIHNAQCIMHNAESIHNSQCIMHNAESIHNAKCKMQNAKSIHNAKCKMQNDKSMQNVESIHNAQCRMHNEFQAESSDYALCIMNYELINALPSFLLASAPYLSHEEYTKYDTQIRTALYNHPATNRFQKASLAITLSN